MFVVDTNVLLYAAEIRFPEHTRCRAALEDWRRQSGAWFLTWSIVYEFIRVSTHPRVFSRPWPVDRAWRFIEVLLESPALSMLTQTDRHASVAEQIFRELPHLRGNVVHDAHTAILMREHGIRDICTRDTDFHQFPFLRVTDPLA